MRGVKITQLRYLLAASLVFLSILSGASWVQASGPDLPCATEYTAQANDWLSKIAEKYLGNPMAYPTIVAATQAKAIDDPTFANISDPDRIKPGWKICIPKTEDAERWLAEASAAEREEYAITLEDAKGRTVAFAQIPQRIVAVGRANFLTIDALFAFPEAKDRIVALEQGTQSTRDFLILVDPSYDEIQIFQHNVGPEQIITAQPEVAVLKGFMAEKLGMPLEELGIPVVYIDLETPDQYSRDITTLGQLFGNPARAKEINDFYQSRLNQISESLEGLTEPEKPSVLVLQYSDKGGEVAFKVPPAAWIQTTQVELAGGKPIWKDDIQDGSWATVGFEQIAAWDPDQIFIVSYNSDPVEVVGKLQANSQWQELRAVKEGHIQAFAKDFYSWDQPDTRWILGLSWLAKTLHPDRFPELDLSQELNEFYGQIYGLDPTQVDTHVLPIVKGDVK